MTRRLSLVFVLCAVAASVLYFGGQRNTDVAVINAQAVPVDAQLQTFVVTFDVQNDGDAQTLTGLSSPSAGMVRVMNPDYGDAPIVIPASSTGAFAMDGAHVMLMNLDKPLAPGASVPLSVIFDAAGEVTTRVMHIRDNVDIGGMDHDMTQGMQVDPSPVITLSAPDGISADGGAIAIAVENFTFTRVADDAPHVAGEGHGHIYLNGLKLGRLYDTTYTLGALPTGRYELAVGLNTNTHKPYMNGDVAVRSVLAFEIP